MNHNEELVRQFDERLGKPPYANGELADGFNTNNKELRDAAIRNWLRNFSPSPAI